MSDEQSTPETEVAPAAEPVILDVKMTVEQINFVLNLLSQLPFKDSAGLINSIRSQAIAQLQNRELSADSAATSEALQ